MSEPKGVVFALFDDEAAADAAVASLKEWDKLDDDVKLTAIGVLAVDEHGKLKNHKVGPRRGIAKGIAIGALIPILAGWIFTPLFWPVVGAIQGATKRGLNLTSERREQLAEELKGGKAAVGVLIKASELEAVSAKLAELGGTPEQLPVTPELEAAAEEVATNAEAEASAR